MYRLGSLCRLRYYILLNFFFFILLRSTHKHAHAHTNRTIYSEKCLLFSIFSMLVGGFLFVVRLISLILFYFIFSVLVFLFISSTNSKRVFISILHSFLLLCLISVLQEQTDRPDRQQAKKQEEETKKSLGTNIFHGQYGISIQNHKRNA